MAQSQFTDLIGPIQAGANLALARREARRRDDAFAEEIRQARELERYRGATLGFQALQEERLGKDFILRQNQENRLARAAAGEAYRKADEDYRRAKVLENIQAETQSLLSAIPPNAAPEMRREAELTGMARGLFKSGMESEGVGVLKQLSSEKMAAIKAQQQEKAFLDLQEQTIGGVPYVRNPMTGKSEVSPRWKMEQDSRKLGIKQEIENIQIKIKNLIGDRDRAELRLAAGKKGEDTRIEAINSMIRHWDKRLEESTAKMGEFTTEMVPGESAAEPAQSPASQLWDRWEAFTRGTTP